MAVPTTTALALSFALVVVAAVAGPAASAPQMTALSMANAESASPVFFQEMQALGASERQRAESALEAMNVPMSSASSLHVDANGHLFYMDDFSDHIGKRRRRTEEEIAERHEMIRRYVLDNPPNGVDPNGIPYYHSRPNAVAKIYLDFDGHVNPSGSAWGAFTAKAFSMDSDYSTFSDSEINDIVDIWKLVSEAFSPFNVDVTTEIPADWQQSVHLHALITESRQVNGNRMPGSNSGGIAYTDIFDITDTAYYSPALIYLDNVGGDVAGVHSTVSHEIGHNFGLDHDGDATSGEYSDTFTDGATSETTWGPIMGAPYDAAIIQWSNGDYPTATNQEDDVQIIGRQTGFAADEAGDSAATSAGMTVTDNNDGTFSFTAKGVIGNRNDKDWYHFNIASSGTVDILALPYYYTDGTGNTLDIKLTLFDSSSTMVAQNNPGGTARASLTGVSLTAGTYYIEIDGVKSPVTVSDYGSLGHYTISGVSTSAVMTVDTTMAPTSAPTTTTTTDPCTGINFVRRERFCRRQCGGSYTFYRDAEDAGFTGCHRKHCECGSTTPATTTVDPCANINFVRKEKFCRRQCGGAYTFYNDAEAAGFTGCHRKHCECTSTTAGPTTENPCAGVNSVRKERWCSNRCGGAYTFYRDAEDAGFTGCHQKHCECTV